MESVHCEPCSALDKHVVADNWCMDCEERLCNQCTEIHKVQKMSKSHHLIQYKEKPQNLNLPSLCTEHDLPLDYFCVDHCSLCCRECLALSHRKCQKVQALDVSALNAKDSESFVDSSRQMDHILQALPSLLCNRERNIIDLESKAKAIKLEIADVKRSFINRLDQVEETLISELDQSKEKYSTEMKSQICEITQLISKTQERKDRFKFIQKHGSDKQAFIFTQTTQQDLQEIEGQVQNICKNAPDITLDYRPNIDIQNVSIGLLNEIKNPNTNLFSPFKHRQSQSLAIKRKVPTTFKYRYDIVPDVLSGTGITGMTVTDNNWLLLCDVTNSQLHIYDEKDAYIKSVNLEGKPWDVASIPNKMIAVYTDRKKAPMNFIDLSTWKTWEKSCVPSDTQCGISVNKDYILVGGQNKIHFLDHDGNHVKTIDIKQYITGEITYLTTSSNGTIIFKSVPNNGIYAVDDTGNLVFNYESKNMKGPRQIVCDDDSNVYIIAQSTHNIHKLSPDGKLIDVVLSEKDKLKDPNACCFNKDFSKLYVANRSGSVITVFRVD